MASKHSTLKPFFLPTRSLEPPSETPRLELELDQNESEDELSSESENEIEQESENEIEKKKVIMNHSMMKVVFVERNVAW